MSRRTWIIIGVVVAVAIAVGVTAIVLSSSKVTVPDVTGKTQADATKALEDAGLKAGAVTQASDSSVAVGLVVRQEPAAGAETGKDSAVALTVSSGPGTAAVPDVTGQTQAEAESTLTSAGFVPQSVTQYDAQAPKDEVIGQLPAAGYQAYAGSTVGMLVSAGVPADVKVPDVSGMPQDQATTTLAEASLAAVPVESYNDGVPKGDVVSQDPAAGTTVAPLTEVLITVSLGPGTTTVTVPDVVGKSQSAATDALVAAGLSATKAEAFSQAIAKGYVIGQEPAAGTKVAKGAGVGLLVSLGSQPSASPTPTPTPTPAPTSTSTPTPKPTSMPKPPDTGQPTVKVPNVVGLTGDEAKTQIAKLGLSPVPLEEASETVAKGTVIAQLPAAGTSVPETYPVLYLVSLGAPPQATTLPASQ